MSKRIWIRESDAPEGDAIYLRRADEGVTLDCPICGGGILLRRMERLFGDTRLDECPECGVQVRVLVQWREA